MPKTATANPATATRPRRPAAAAKAAAAPDLSSLDPDPRTPTPANPGPTRPPTDPRDVEIERLRAELAAQPAPAAAAVPTDPRDVEIERLRAELAAATPDTVEAPAGPPPERGDVVTATHHDPYTGAGGQTVTRYGLVLDADGDYPTVAWFNDVTTGIPATDLTVV